MVHDRTTSFLDDAFVPRTLSLVSVVTTQIRLIGPWSDVYQLSRMRLSWESAGGGWGGGVGGSGGAGGGGDWYVPRATCSILYFRSQDVVGIPGTP